MSNLTFYRNRLVRTSLAFRLVRGRRMTGFVTVLVCVGQSLTCASAQDLDKRSINVGESEIVPELRIDYVLTDNAYNTSSDPTESAGVLLSPSLDWETDRRLLKITAEYWGQYGSYSESNLNFNDHDLAFRIEAAPGIQHRTFGEFSINKSHEAFGTGQSTFSSETSEQLVSTAVQLKTGYTFGVASAKGNVGGGLLIGTQTFNDLGTITDGDDNTQIAPYLFFSYRVSPDTRFVTEASISLSDYDEDRRDRTEIGLSAGLDLAATERAGGSFRLGVSRADYDVVTSSDTSQVISNGNLYFKPRTYSRFDLSFDRRLLTVDADTTGSGASLVNSGALTWSHDWSSRFSTVASWSTTQTERNCPNNDSASTSAGFEVNVKVRRWLTVGAGVDAISRSADLCDSTIAVDEFDSESTTLGVHVVGSL